MKYSMVWLAFLALLSAVLFVEPCLATVSGDCSICHTMHNSEVGSEVAYTLSATGERLLREEPIENLLRTDCLGCHSHSSAQTIVEIGNVVIPIVFNLVEPTYPPTGSTISVLAGGNFHWMMNGGDANGHNLLPISDVDLRFPPNQAPGGVARSGECANCHGSLATTQSGCQGCHVAEHHAEITGVVAGRAEGWFRFLGSVMQNDIAAPKGALPTEEGVVGIESPDWEQNPLLDQHNAYQGNTGPFSNYLESGSISQKCMGCHGRFHDETISDVVWIRHPVDVAIPNSGEFTGMGSYSPLAPVARPGITETDANFTVVNRGSDQVTCVSCHRAHGSPYPAMMRWGYRDWPGIDSHTNQPAENGCAICHTSKN